MNMSWLLPWNLQKVGKTYWLCAFNWYIPDHFSLIWCLAAWKCHIICQKEYDESKVIWEISFLFVLLYPCRPTPIWLVSSAAQKSSPSARTESLSQPKPLSPLYKPERSPYTLVTPGATRATSTARLDVLAVPRQKSDLATIRDPTESVSSAALKATATGRVEQLAESKKLHPSYQEEKPIQWPVSDSAMKAIASLRLQQLARPRSRSLLKDDYDPYKVTFAARHAHTTPRVDELAVPLPRKVVAKK